MSVINKMLRDLDSRHASGGVPISGPQSRIGIARDTLILNDSALAPRRLGMPGWVLLLLSGVVLLAGAAGVWWYLDQNRLLPPRVAQVKPAAAAAPLKPLLADAPAALPASVAVALPRTVVVPAAMPASQPAVAASAALPARDGSVAELPSPQKIAKSNSVVVPKPMPEPALKHDTHVSKAVVPVKKSSMPTAMAPAKPLRQSSVQEALAQAQSLWNTGSHQAAIDLLYEALASAERTSAAAAPTGNNAVIALLVRELSSMALAEGQVRATLELLTRLEPALSQVADIWAIRGNAAQRLGRHAESAAAYQTALKLRPDEPRWLLGAAVSLAAQGQTAAAAELAEKARAGGAMTREVAMYLRQLGVPLSER